MDVTPRELRDVEIREAFRGYNRDEVNDLLERAAAAIESLNERARVLGERLAAGQGESGRSRETEDMLHRTLLLAQRASDEAIAEAEAKAREMIEEAETRSRKMLADAAVEARRTTESERRRLEQEISDLQARREALSGDVDGLEHFESDYRTRLVDTMEADLRKIESDLQAIRDRAAAAPGDRPALDADTYGGPATMEVDVRGFVDDKRRPLIGSGSGPITGPVAVAASAAAAASELIGAPAPAPAAEPEPEEAEIVPEPSAATADAPAASAANATGPATIDLFGAEQQAAVESAAASLDDDSFFASLRDAVRDDAPLGPREAEERAFFDQDSKEAPSFRETFKRRR